jgi:hypothetical protein
MGGETGVSPEAPGSLVVLDFAVSESGWTAEVDLLLPRGAKEWLFVSWNAEDCAGDLTAMGGGCVCVLVPDGYKRLTYPAAAEERIGRWLGWSQQVEGEGMMVVALFPDGYVVDGTEDLRPPPARAKEFRDRLAVYWIVEHGHADVSWNPRPVTGASEVAECVNRLNDSEAEAVVRQGPVFVED